MKRIIFPLSIIFCLGLNVDGKNITLILTGVDTILTNHEYGFDFINEVACTTLTYQPPYDCNNHFKFVYYPMIGQFDLGVNNGYGIQCGKINLDSIRTAPPDSSFKLLQHIDSIPQDSLSTYVGNSYIFKTGVDPRYSSIFFAKIRILGFRVIDSATHRIEMRFLWACNVNSSRNISTSNLDTFHLNTNAISNGATRNPFVYSSRQKVFKVVGDRFIVPKELAGASVNLSVFNVAGKRLGRLLIKEKRVVDLKEIKEKNSGVIIVKIDR
jgi:hypothetical protein